MDGRRVGVVFQGGSELALIPNLMHMPRGWQIQSMEGKVRLCLDSLSFELDTVITTKSRLRALKIT